MTTEDKEKTRSPENYEYWVIKDFINSLPRPESPYEQAIAYRKLVGME